MQIGIRERDGNNNDSCLVIPPIIRLILKVNIIITKERKEEAIIIPAK